MKSHAKDFFELASACYKDAVALCPVDVFDERDLKTIEARLAKEGISFLTITLPDFSKDFEKSLELGQVTPTLFRSFKKSGAIPAFLRGMLCHIFCPKTGRIKDVEIDQISESASDVNTSVGGTGVSRCACRPLNRGFQRTRSISEAHTRCAYDCDFVRAVRRICRFFAKLVLDCTPKRVTAAFENFVKTEQEVSEFRLKEDVEDDLESKFKITSHFLWGPPLSTISLGRLRFSHGPGATVERLSPNEKYRWTVWPDHFEPYFPFYDSAYVVNAAFEDEGEKVRFISHQEVQPARVVDVPKTLRSPRLIAIEPVHNQYAQQGLRNAIYDALEADSRLAGHIQFRDQSINQSIALESSRSRSFSTIDLKDASDRVPRSLALTMFDFHPDLRDAILACTSNTAQLPDGSVMDLKKFASMGNALCFPVEAMYFFTICTIALLESLKLQLTRDNVRKVVSSIYVYGDDIAVPVNATGKVIEYLELYGCRVNTAKSFVHGHFRESCGCDAYRGEDVTPVYLRRVKPRSLRDASEIVSWVATANSLYLKGMWNTARVMFRSVEKILGALPRVPIDSDALGRHTFQDARTLQRWNKDLQRFEVKAWVARPVKFSDPLDGYPALSKCLLKLAGWDGSPIPPSKHLQESERHNVVSLKRCWVPSH